MTQKNKIRVNEVDWPDQTSAVLTMDAVGVYSAVSAAEAGARMLCFEEDTEGDFDEEL